MNTNYIKRNKLKKGRYFLTLFILAFLWTSNSLFGQDNCGESTIANAEKDYFIGKFGNTLSSLNSCLESEGFNLTQKESAFRILGWTYIARFYLRSKKCSQEIIKYKSIIQHKI